MSISARTILLSVWCLLALWQRQAAGTENQAFTAAEQVYLDADYQGAETNFSDFIQKYPNSARIAEAILYQAQSRIKLGDYNGALSLLAARQNQAGTLTDWYLLCQGEALLAKGDFAKAEEDFSKLNQQFPTSPHRLAAVVNSAAARMRQSKWPLVVELLAQTNGIFQLTASTNHASSDVIRGYLLLSEAQLAQNDTRAAEQSLQYLTNSPLDATNNWQRQYLLCRTLSAGGRLDEALQNTTNLLVLADATGQRSFQARTTAFQAGLLERLGRPEDALAVYQKNLTAGIPASQQREALLKITQLSLSIGKIADAAQVLQTFLTQFPTNDSSDLALLTLGELRLGQYQPGGTTNFIVLSSTNAPGPTNFLQEAIAAFRSFPTLFPRSLLLGKAQLDLGWCYWLGGNLPESQASFQTAIDSLRPSVDQAEAFFKLADTQYQLTNYPGAISNYNAVVERFTAFPEVQTNLAEPALYQVVRASQAAGDQNSETNALARIMAMYPGGSYTKRAVALAGQQVGGSFPSLVRTLFSGVPRDATNSTLLPEVDLAISRTYEEEGRWDDAIHQYDTWLLTYTNDAAQDRAEYFRALANYKAGSETNALSQFTNLLARFPVSEYAPLAQWWVADYFYRLGNFLEAESNYKFVFQKFNNSKLAYPARMMAGRMAFQRQDWDNAPGYFLALANDKSCPEDLRGEALFAYGDTWISRSSTNKISDYQEALNIFHLICQTYPATEIAALAWGQTGICLLQFARASTNYASATNAFQQVIDSPLAGPTARSIAEVGLAFTIEKIADTTANDPDKIELLKVALRHYQRIFYDNNFLREGEKRDPFWTKKAGLDAARVAERLGLREHAISLYRRLEQMFPPLQLEDKIKMLQAQG
jgi:TolA-binding protein